MGNECTTTSTDKPRRSQELKFNETYVRARQSLIIEGLSKQVLKKVPHSEDKEDLLDVIEKYNEELTWSEVRPSQTVNSYRERHTWHQLPDGDWYQGQIDLDSRVPFGIGIVIRVQLCEVHLGFYDQTGQMVDGVIVDTESVRKVGSNGSSTQI